MVIKMKKRWTMALLSMITIVSLIAGCGQGGTQSAGTEEAAQEEMEEDKSEEAAPVQEERTAEETADAGEKIILRVWHGFTAESVKAVVEETFEKYNQSQDKVEIVYDAFSSGDLLQAYTLGAISGELPDIGFNDNPAWASLCEMGVFIDIDDWYQEWEEKDMILENILQSGIYNNKVYGVPFGPNCLALWCNTELLKAAGYEDPPKTMEEFVEIAKATTDPANGVYGFVMGGFKNEAGTFQNLPWLMSEGGDIYDLTSEGSRKALSMMKDLYDNGNISSESLNLTQSDALNQFMAGNAAMYLSGSWNVATIRNNAPELVYTCSPVPTGTDSVSCLGGELIGITSACENVEAAQDFIEWFLSHDVNLEFCAGCTRFSPRKDISAQDLYPDDEIMAVYADLLPGAYARGGTPLWNDISGVFQNCYQEIYAGAKEVDEATEAAAAEIKTITGE